MNMKRIAYYLKIWWHMNLRNLLPIFANNYTFIVFLIGKIFRFGLFTTFLFFLLKGTNTLVGYSWEQTFIFFLTFNLIDVVSQFLFRGVYKFRSELISGSFDHTLVKPLNPLFKSLLGGADPIDLLTIPPLIVLIWIYGNNILANLVDVLYYVLLVLNGIIIATSFHIVILAFGLITLEVDNMILIYRDLTSLGRFPVDIYKEPVKSLITYFLPVGIMITLPAKALFGIISFGGVFSSLIFGISFLYISNQFWKFALKKYTSASS